MLVSQTFIIIPQLSLVVGLLRALIVSDIHSNIEALESVLEHAQSNGGFDQIWSLGDLVGYGPDPDKCIEILSYHDTLSVAGNHDLAAVGRLSTEAFNLDAAAATDWTATQLSTEHKNYLQSLKLRIIHGDFTMVHGSPRDPVWEYVVSTQAAITSFLHFDTQCCLVGHSHIPFICRDTEKGATFMEFPVGEPVRLGVDRLIINPGGVGQPRDGDPRASFAIYDGDRRNIIHLRVEYDIAKTQQKIIENGLPTRLADRLSYGR